MSTRFSNRPRGASSRFRANTIARRLLVIAVPVIIAALSWASGRWGPGFRETPVIPASVGGETASPARPSGRVPDAIRRDLRADEQLGGHTLERHVGKTDDDLAARLGRERQISAASTYTDADTAERAVGAALAQSQGRLDAWLARSGARPNLVLTYTQATGPPLGRSLPRGTRASVPCNRALVVLRWDERADRWFVLTSYPEARP